MRQEGYWGPSFDETECDQLVLSILSVRLFLSLGSIIFLIVGVAKKRNQRHCPFSPATSPRDDDTFFGKDSSLFDFS